MIRRFFKKSMRGLSVVVGLCILSTGYVLAASSKGEVSFNPQDSVVAPSKAFEVHIVVNTGTQKLAAYSFSITFDPSVVTIDTSKGTQGVEAGADGFFKEVNTDNVAGTLNVDGLDVSGKGPSSALDLLVIHFQAKNKPGGKSTLGLTVNRLVDEAPANVGTPKGIPGSVTISATPSGGGGGGGGGCFIATAAFGTPMAKEVKVLSRFRDHYLLTNAIGRKFVAFYYKYGPGWAKYISDKEGLKAAVRVGLRPLIWLSELLPKDRTKD